ncbi:precorrin-8X methylmutase [Polycladidibacter stylochi]|uniref:precorrin-8X methylmutase n=1 Tax=Polycladidibacter stylochi TaxID=1807766 RepID=UPI001AD8BDD7|nr:precorrin-8X methylmutase [Pseudovibrio stylochi]
MNPTTYDYIRDPKKIYERSFEIVRSEAKLDHLPAALHPVAIRLIHACGMVDLPQDLDASEGVVEKAHAALQNGAPILTDVEMVAHGIIKRYLPAQNEVICTLNEPEVIRFSHDLGNTRSAAAITLWKPYLNGAVVAIGNAPTALFYLLECIAAGWGLPAAVLGFPVGFVGAAESKQALSENDLGIPYLTVHGRRGGSALAAAAVNAVAAGLPEETKG